MSKKVNVIEEALGQTKEDQEAVLAAQGLNFARKFNRKFKTLQKTETALIDIVREVVALDSNKVRTAFKKNVNADDSTVNRYIKIAECRKGFRSFDCSSILKVHLGTARRFRWAGHLQSRQDSDDHICGS